MNGIQYIALLVVIYIKQPSAHIGTVYHIMTFSVQYYGLGFVSIVQVPCLEYACNGMLISVPVRILMI